MTTVYNDYGVTLILKVNATSDFSQWSHKELNEPWKRYLWRIHSKKSFIEETSFFHINSDYLNRLTLVSVGLSVKPSSKSGRDEHIIVSSVSCVRASTQYRVSAGGPLHTISVNRVQNMLYLQYNFSYLLRLVLDIKCACFTDSIVFFSY